jgi:hypothetical protein
MPPSRGFATFDLAEGAATERCSVLIPEPKTVSSAGTVCAVGWRWPIGASHRALGGSVREQSRCSPEDRGDKNFAHDVLHHGVKAFGISFVVDRYCHRI